MSIEEGAMVVPGDALGAEEEFAPSENTYLEKGTIRAAIFGKVHVGDGKVSVSNPSSEIKMIKRGMHIIGTVVADVRAVVFVEIDNIVKANGIEYLALKDGKIVAERTGRPMGRSFGGEGRGRPEAKPPKQCGVGDIIFAKVLFDDPEIYTLGIRDEETGVVFAACEMCGSHMKPVKEKYGLLVCQKCKHTEQRKISSLYDNMNEIKKHLA
jgi:exosome complex RNA-binding protein Csl4